MAQPTLIDGIRESAVKSAQAVQALSDMRESSNKDELHAAVLAVFIAAYCESAGPELAVTGTILCAILNKRH